MERFSYAMLRDELDKQRATKQDAEIARLRSVLATARTALAMAELSIDDGDPRSPTGRKIGAVVDLVDMALGVGNE